MDSICGQFFPRAALSLDQHFGILLAYFIDQFANLLYPRGISDHSVPRLQIFLLLPETMIEFLLFGDISRSDHYLWQRKRFFHKIVRTDFDRLDGHADVTVSGDHDDIHIRVFFQHLLQHLDPVNAR